MQKLLSAQRATKKATAKPNERICTYNIRTGRNSGIAAACVMLGRANVGLALLTETKITDNIYPKLSSDYTIVATRAVSYSQGGIALATREEKH